MSRFFGDAAVLRDVSFALSAGTLTMLLGANGAGKSTLLRILAGALRPSQGAVRLGDHPAGSAVAHRQTGFLSHQSLLHPALTVRENLHFYGRLFGLGPVATTAALTAVGAAAFAERRVGELSQGMKQKAALARCLQHEPRLLLLDEPFASLDSATVADLRATLLHLRAQGLAILLSSHQTEPVAGVADAALQLERGRLAAGVAA